MGKPSIFSKDYKKKMKRRKRWITLAIIGIILAIGAIVFNSEVKNMDFTNMRAKIQAWVDSGKQENTVEEAPKEEETVENVEKQEEVKTPEKLYMDFNINEGVVVKAEYTEEGGKKFVAVDPIEGYTFNISPTGQKLLVLDNNQNILICSLDGAITNATKTTYVSKSGTTFAKDSILASNPTYTWHSEAKFIDDNYIVYVSEMPYFNTAGSTKYLWIHDLANGTDNTIWAIKGSNIVVSDVVPEKGITINVDGNVSYLNANGEIVK